jgi:glyoxylase-like metal-dependent hydrolase (beta-lactamase superfamily II)
LSYKVSTFKNRNWDISLLEFLQRLREDKSKVKTNSYSFKLGNFSCLIVNDGQMYLPDTSGRQDSQDKAPNPIEINIMSLLVNTGKNKVLIDTGIGPGNEMAPLAGFLTQNLAEAGIKREEIDTVIFSHTHPDHIGGTFNNSGSLVFPNARYFLCRKEWEFWVNESNYKTLPEQVRQNSISAVQKNILPLKKILNLIDCEKEIVPGVSCISAPGHSPGHMALIISSGKEQLLCTFDAFHNPQEIGKPDLFLIPPATGEAAKTRDILLAKATEPNMLVFAGHFPFPGLGRIIQQNNINYWQPISNY